jgi:hypothetical protein
MMSLKFKYASEVAKACSGAYQESLAWARKECGRGFFQSRGRAIKGIDKKGEIVYGEAESCLWDGSAKDLWSSINAAREAGAAAVYVEGGVNFASNLVEYQDGAYDPWVAEWSVLVWGEA